MDYVKVPLMDLDDVDAYVNSPKQKKLIDNVYHLKEFNKMLEEVIDDYIEQVVFMTDEELVYDRSDFIKNHALVEGNKHLDDYHREMHIHSICIEIEQLRRFDKIVYEKPRKRTGENNRITEGV